MNTISKNSTIYEEDIDLNLIINFLFRNYKKIIIFTLISTIIALLFSLTRKKTWEGEFQIVLDNPNSQNSSLTSAISLPFGENLLKKNSSLPTQVGILESRSVLMPVFEYVKNEKKKNKIEINFSTWKRNALDIGLSKKTSILNITYRDKDKELILPVLKKISEEYQKYSGKSKKRDLELTKIYLEEQINLYKNKSFESLKKAQEYAFDKDLLLINIGNSFGSENIESFGFENIESNSGLESIRVNAANQIKKIKLQIEKIEELDQNYEDIQILATIIPYLGSSELVEEYNLNQKNLVDLELRYTSNDPLVKKLKAKKISLSKLIKESAIGFLQSELLAQESLMQASIRPKEVVLNYKELIRNAFRDERILVNLENNLIETKLEEEKYDDPWELISSPTVKRKPIAPKKSIYGLWGIVLGLISAISYAFLKEKKLDLIYEDENIANSFNSEIIASVNLNSKSFLLSSKEILEQQFANNKSIDNLKFLALGENCLKKSEDFFKLISNIESSFSIETDFKKFNKNDKPFLLISKGNLTNKELKIFVKKIEVFKINLSGIIILI